MLVMFRLCSFNTLAGAAVLVIASSARFAQTLAATSPGAEVLGQRVAFALILSLVGALALAGGVGSQSLFGVGLFMPAAAAIALAAASIPIIVTYRGVALVAF